jgi:hypothetical protein
MTSSDEVWLPVPGYPSYEVSDHGQVRSIDREGLSRWGTPRMFPGRLLAQTLSGGSKGRKYRACTLYRDGEPRAVTIHTLVLQTFVGPRPRKTQGCHRDDNPENNHLNNLYWGTPRQNAQDMIRNGRCWKTNITHCPQGHEYTEENTYVYPRTGHRQCLTCIKSRNKGNANHTRTHCPQGHPYDEVNTLHVAGRRQCKECGRNRSREYQRAKRRAKLA